MAIATLNNGKYTLESQLGVGIFGTTYKAIAQPGGKEVVIKTLAPALHNHKEYSEFKSKFMHTGELLWQCEHPHLVRVIDCFEENDLPFLVMIYVPGQTLGELQKSGVRFTPEQVVNYTKQIGTALAQMHDRGLIHGDVRPENIICRQGTEELVLTDVGIVCNFTLGIRQTYANLLLAGYASPEHYLQDFTPRPADDIYALAATCYSLLTGKSPAIARVNHPHAALTGLDPRLEQAIFHFGLQGAEWRSPDMQSWLALLPDNSIPPLKYDRGVAVSEETKNPQPSKNSQNSGNSRKPAKKATAASGITRISRLLTSRTSPNLQNSQMKSSSILKLLVFTGAIAGISGAIFGLAVRIYRPVIPGDSMLHTEQSFPPRQNWPISETGL
ncbi:MAG: serine/threonine protein kinase [Coleofasciculaceae cyanobacterium SM2_1_6]|nr:serine/threonine protein kinase [Coleofasciculaceae cyanobacterium SM2_1_6]